MEHETPQNRQEIQQITMIKTVRKRTPAHDNIIIMIRANLLNRLLEGMMVKVILQTTPHILHLRELHRVKRCIPKQI